MPWIKACKTEEIPGQGGFKLDLDDRSIGIYRCDAAFRAASAICPHAKAFLTEGSVEGDIATCPKHGWKWNLADGTAVGNSGYAIQLYRLKEENGDIWVELP